MTKPQRRLPGRQKPLNLSKLDRLKSAVPDSPLAAIEQLFIFDARCLDKQTRQELLRLLPELVHISRAWKAEFLENGCVHCRRKDVYGAGGFCGNCRARYYHRMVDRYKPSVEGREEKTAAFRDALSLKYNAAQRLLNGEEK